MMDARQFSMLLDQVETAVQTAVTKLLASHRERRKQPAAGQEAQAAKKSRRRLPEPKVGDVWVGVKRRKGKREGGNLKVLSLSAAGATVLTEGGHTRTVKVTSIKNGYRPEGW